ncbi:MAG: tRNA-dihydrouridine synthase, partial [Candidatus Paceibacterota bacterium]
GRASFGNPWIFLDQEVDIKTRAKVAVEHSQLFEKTFQHREKYRFLPMRKHLSWYIRGFANASEVRTELMQTETAQEVENILKRANLI